jgi:glycosyltransferase involved in cell wall biosynthesis
MNIDTDGQISAQSPLKGRSSMPDVSILIPAYNAEQHIGQAIESALNQKNVNVEVIVIDDGSTDGTLQEIQGFGDRIVWETGPNRGATTARNRAIDLAKANWVSFLDADDYYLPEKTADQLKLVAKDHSVDVLYGPSTFESTQNGTVQTGLEPIPEPHDPWALLALWNLPQTGAPLWRKQALLDVGGFKEEQPCCQEHELYLRLLIAGKTFRYADAGGSVYRRFETGTLSTKNPARVRNERRKIEARLQAHLAATGQLTPLRQRAIDQARFEMARTAWPVDPQEAKAIYSEISTKRFRPTGQAAPMAYQIAYRLGGFGFAERVAALRRNET